jgi:hypothetical protein
MAAENSAEQPARPWVKGGPSPNPGGRPRVVHEVRELARAHTARAIERLADMLDDEDGRVVVAAASTLLDRGWGKPEQAVVAEVSVAAVDVDALRATLAARVAQLASRTSGPEATPALPPGASEGAPPDGSGAGVGQESGDSACRLRGAPQAPDATRDSAC